MDRIGKLSGELSAQRNGIPKFVDDAKAWMHFDALLPASTKEVTKKIRATLGEEKVYNRILDYVETAEFPQDLIPALKKLDLCKYFYKSKYGMGDKYSMWDLVNVILELGRIDGSVGTLVLVQNCLLGKTIEMFGSEEQKAHYLPKIINMDIIGGWGLTEVLNGSDASGMETTCRREGDEWVINGNKRWIGNANKDVMVVFAKEEKTKEVLAFIVPLTTPGIKREAIKHKMALRPVQNMQLHYTNVRIPASNQLPGVKGFASVATLLAESRICVAWLACGLGLGLYDYMMKYVTKRIQFGKPIAAYQLMQEKIFKVMSRVQASLFFCYNITQLQIQGKATIGQLATAKAFATEMLREASRFGREALGGNGIISDNHVMRVLVDAEVLYTYEGTYDINLMVAGRELTGHAAFKTR